MSSDVILSLEALRSVARLIAEHSPDEAKRTAAAERVRAYDAALALMRRSA